MSIIRSYHSQNKAERKFGRKDRYHIGFELEVENGAGYDVTGTDNEDAAKMVRDTFAAKKYVYFERDGSLRCGFEIITAPQTVKYLRQHFDLWTQALTELSRRGFKSHETGTCGLHVHVGKEAFGELESEQDYNLTKACLIVERFWNDMVTLARRDSSWARRIGVTNPKDVESFVKRAKQCSSDHGRAVNLGNEHTVEFRVFKGTLKPETLAASIELVVAIISAANNLKAKDIEHAASLREVLTRGCVGKLNATLDAYMVSKGL